MKTFRLSCFLKDEGHNFDYRYGKTVDLKQLTDPEEREIILDNLKGYFDSVMDEIANDLDGEQFGEDDESDVTNEH